MKRGLAKAIAFIEEVQNARSIADVQDSLSMTMLGLGLSTYCIAAMPDPGGRPVESLVIANWNPQWYERYVRNNYINIDPVAAAFHHSREPFTWAEAAAAVEPGHPGRQVMEEAASHGLKVGYCVPIITFTGEVVAASFGGDREALTEDEKGALELIAIYAQNRASTLLTRDDESDAILSPRERECLQWTAVGKTSWEIAQILGISQHTIDWYIAAATRKLKAVNRIQAVAEAMRRGLIL